MTPSLELVNRALQYHPFNDDPFMQSERDLSSSSNSADLDADNDPTSYGDDIISNVEITKPGPHDVLLGRGGGTNNHSGNIKFRKLVNEHKIRYLACSKVDKPKVAREVVKLWRKMEPPGRFLARKDETKRGPGSIKGSDNVWYEVGDKKAREKASQCLRERTPEVLPYIKHLREQQDAITEQGVTMVQQHLQMQQQQQQQQRQTESLSQVLNPSQQQQQQLPQSQHCFVDYMTAGTAAMQGSQPLNQALSLPNFPQPSRRNSITVPAEPVTVMTSLPSHGQFLQQRTPVNLMQQQQHASPLHYAHSLSSQEPSFISNAGAASHSTARTLQQMTASMVTPDLYGNNNNLNSAFVDDSYYLVQHDNGGLVLQNASTMNELEYHNMLLLEQEQVLQQQHQLRLQQQRVQQQQQHLQQKQQQQHLIQQQHLMQQQQQQQHLMQQQQQQQLMEQQLMEQQMMEQQMMEQQMMEQQMIEQQMMEQKMIEQQMMEQQMMEQKMIEQQMIEQQMIQQQYVSPQQRHFQISQLQAQQQNTANSVFHASQQQQKLQPHLANAVRPGTALIAAVGPEEDFAEPEPYAVQSDPLFDLGRAATAAARAVDSVPKVPRRKPSTRPRSRPRPPTATAPQTAPARSPPPPPQPAAQAPSPPPPRVTTPPPPAPQAPQLPAPTAPTVVAATAPEESRTSNPSSKRARETPVERKAPDRAPTSTSLMSTNTPISEFGGGGGGIGATGEITIEEYRKQLEEYIENNQLQTNHSFADEDDDDDDDDVDCPSDLEDDWEKEREKNLKRQQRMQETERKRGVGRTASGCSLMSAKTTKSTSLSIVSGLMNMSTTMFSTEEGLSENGENDEDDDDNDNGQEVKPTDGTGRSKRERKMSASRSLCSSLSLMSELTDLSENIEQLVLSDDDD